MFEVDMETIKTDTKSNYLITSAKIIGCIAFTIIARKINNWYIDKQQKNAFSNWEDPSKDMAQKKLEIREYYRNRPEIGHEETVNLSDLGLNSLPPVRNKMEVKNLLASGNNLTDLSSLLQFQNLEKAVLRNNNITHISKKTLQELPDLTYLDVTRNPLDAETTQWIKVCSKPRIVYEENIEKDS